MKILLVDDDAFLRDMYATKFSEKGHTIDVAETAESALSKLHDGEYDAVLMDMIMPGMNGIELLKQIHEEKLGGEPSVLCSQIKVRARPRSRAFCGSKGIYCEGRTYTK